MTNCCVERSHLNYVKVAGFLYLIILLWDMLAQLFVHSKLTVFSNATIAVNHFLSSEWLLQIGIVNELINFFNSLVELFIMGINMLNHFTALLFSGYSDYFLIFELDQYYTVELLYLNAHQFNNIFGLIFFGLHFSIFGYLFLKSYYRS